MQSKAIDVNEYMDQLPQERKEAMTALRNVIQNNLPSGFEETTIYGMIGYVVPLSTYTI